ncbi:MAG: phasin family protein [Cyclobacteriaceae bacterium]
MEDLFKKFVYTSVGMVALTAEKIEGVIDKLIKDNKISKDEGKKIVDDFLKNTETKKDEFEAQLKSITERVVSGFNFATTKEVNALRKRVEDLERKSNPAPAKAAPKAKKTEPQKV